MGVYEPATVRVAPSPASRTVVSASGASRRRFLSRILSRATVTYCVVCGEEITARSDAKAPAVDRYCVEDHTRTVR